MSLFVGKHGEMESPDRFYTEAVFNRHTLEKKKKQGIGCVCVCVLVCCRVVCQQDQHQVTQSDLNQPGLIKAALRLGGPETQRSFCCPTQGVFPLEGERGAGGGAFSLERKKPFLGSGAHYFIVYQWI